MCIKELMGALKLMLQYFKSYIYFMLNLLLLACLDLCICVVWCSNNVSL